MLLVTPNCQDLFEPNIQIGEFPDRDSHIRIPGLDKLKNQEVTVLHRLYPKQNSALVSLLFILDVLRQQDCATTVVVPYLPYARQDKITIDGEVASAHAVCRLLNQNGCKKLITFDCHFLHSEGPTNYHGLNIVNVSMSKYILEKAKNFFMGEEFAVIGPDAGADYLVKGAGGKSMRKVRQKYQSGTIDYREIESMVCDVDVKDQNILLLDDMISTGSTMIRALEKMRVCGAKKVCCAATHGLFLYDSLDKIKKLSDCIGTSDTIKQNAKQIKIVSIKPILEEILNNTTKLIN